MKDLLQIYDADDGLMRTTGTMRGADEVLGISGGAEVLRMALDRLVADGKVFQRAVFHTHGNEGLITFGSAKERKHWIIDANALLTDFKGRGYEKLFAYSARIYFNGCKISRGEAGWKFLEAAASIFLRRNGGTTFAHPTNGYPLASTIFPLFFGIGGWLTFSQLRGHAHHFSPAQYVAILPGGTILGRYPESNDDPGKTWRDADKGRVWTGRTQ
jgi:hypothetical protein